MKSSEIRGGDLAWRQSAEKQEEEALTRRPKPNTAPASKLPAEGGDTEAFSRKSSRGPGQKRQAVLLTGQVHRTHKSPTGDSAHCGMGQQWKGMNVFGSGDEARSHL